MTRTALFPSLFVVRAAKTTAVERASVNSVVVASLLRGAFFHGVRSGNWVRRLGGGYVIGVCVEEVL